MSPPINFTPPPGAIYDDELGVCRPAEEPLPTLGLCEASASLAPAPIILDRSQISVARLYHDAFGSPNTAPVNRGIWGLSPARFSGWALAGSLTACSSEPSDAPVPGDPISRVEALGGESTLNSQPIRGNIDGVGLGSNDGNRSVVAWSAFDATSPANTGTFAFLRSSETGGSQFTVSGEATSRHLSTTTAMLSDGNAVVVFTRATGTDSPTSIVAQRVNSSGAPQGGEIEILAPEIRDSAPAAQVVATESGFVVVFRGGSGNLQARLFNNSGAPQGSAVNLGTAPSQYALASGFANRWALAEIVTPNRIRTRTFDGAASAGSEHTLSVPNFPSDPDISLAMQGDGSMMQAWNTLEGSDNRIDGALLNEAGERVAGPFVIRRSGLANTLALASDHRGNYAFAWEEGGRINARIYNGTQEFFTPTDFSNISTGTANSNILLSVSPEGILSLVYDKTSESGGDVLHSITRRDYRIIYQ